MATILRRSVAHARQFAAIPTQFGTTLSSPRSYDLRGIGLDAQGVVHSSGGVTATEMSLYVHEGFVAPLTSVRGGSSLWPEKKAFVLERFFKTPYYGIHALLPMLTSLPSLGEYAIPVFHHSVKIMDCYFASYVVHSPTFTAETTNLAMASLPLCVSTGARWGSAMRSSSSPYVQRRLMHSSPSPQRPGWCDVKNWLMDKLRSMLNSLASTIKETADLREKYKSVFALVGSIMAFCYWIALETHEFFKACTASVSAEVGKSLDELRFEMVSSQLELKESLQLHYDLLKDLNGLAISRCVTREEVQASEKLYRDRMEHLDLRLKTLEEQIDKAAKQRRYYLF